MPADISDPDFEPEWLWNTRVTAEAARAAMINGRTRLQRVEIYQRLISEACEARQRRKNPQHIDSNVEASPPRPGDFLYDDIAAEANIPISGFESAIGG
jgi:hypothetical protein